MVDLVNNLEDFMSSALPIWVTYVAHFLENLDKLLSSLIKKEKENRIHRLSLIFFIIHIKRPSFDGHKQYWGNDYR